MSNMSEVKPGRRATWFELFFDLVFVAGVARLAGGLAADFTFFGFLRFAFLFVVLWWPWVAHTFYATRFDEDRPLQRMLGLGKIAAVVFIAYAAPKAFGEGGLIFALAVAAFKALLAAAYLIAARRGGEGAQVARIYAVMVGAGCLIWLASAAAPDAARPYFWGAGLALDVASPFVVTRFTHAVPPHPEHLPERFGLFVIILLGETVAALVHALDHLTTILAKDVAVILLAMAVPFLFWWGYFDTVRGAAERHVRSREDARRLQLWAYAHIPLLLGTAVMAVGGRLVVEHAKFGLEPALLLSGATGAAMAALTAIAASHQPSSGSRAPYFAGAMLAAASGFAISVLGPVGLLAALAVIACALTFGAVLAGRTRVSPGGPSQAS